MITNKPKPIAPTLAKITNIKLAAAAINRAFKNLNIVSMMATSPFI